MRFEGKVYRPKGFHARIYPGEGNTFSIGANDSTVLISFMLKRQREFRDLTIRQVASRMHSKSPNAYAQYEKGKISPSLDTLVKLLKAMDPGFEPALKAS